MLLLIMLLLKAIIKKKDFEKLSSEHIWGFLLFFIEAK